MDTFMLRRLPTSLREIDLEPDDLALFVLELPRHVADIGADLQVGRKSRQRVAMNAARPAASAPRRVNFANIRSSKVARWSDQHMFHSCDLQSISAGHACFGS